MIKSSFSFIFCFCAFFPLQSQKTIADSSRIFSSQLFNLRNNLTLHFEENKVIGSRNQERIQSDLSEITLFIETDVSVNARSNGSVQVSSYDTNTWFIPLNLGDNPFKLMPGKCMRISCSRKENYVYDCPPCELLDTYDRITVIGGIDARCSRAYMLGTDYADCDSLLPYDYYGSGVIVNAEIVSIKDPEWFKPNPVRSIKFMIDDNGNINILEEKEKKD